MLSCPVRNPGYHQLPSSADQARILSQAWLLSFASYLYLSRLSTGVYLYLSRLSTYTSRVYIKSIHLYLSRLSA